MSTEYGEFARVYDLLMRDVPYAAWTRYLLGLLELGGVTPGDTLLDCASGTGEFALRFSKAGFCVTGSDRSEEMLDRAQEKARKAGQKIPFVQQDLRALSLHKPVSAINCACDGVNYLLDEQEVNAFFRGANRALKPGGLLLFDVSSAYKLEHILGERTYGEDTKDCTYLWRNCYDPDARLLEMRLAFFLPKGNGSYERFDERHLQRAHRTEELTDALGQNGFSVEGVYEWPSRNEPGPASERIQFAARKTAECEAARTR